MREPPSPPQQIREPAPETEIEEFDDEMIVEAELVEEHDASDAESETGRSPQPGDGERTGRKRRRRRRGGRRSRRDRDTEPLGDSSGESAGVAETIEAVEGTETEAVTTTPSEDGPHKGRRRRRRGSGRSRDAKRSVEGEAKQRLDDPAERSDEADLDDESDDDLGDLGADPADSDQGELGADDSGESSLDKNSHRAIPAWEEAIGYIVSINMESRAKNPKAGSPRGRGRGRGRGSRGPDHRRPS